MSSNNALELSREQTRERLMRALYRAQVRQKVVARHRTKVRYLSRVVRRVIGVMVVASGSLWACMEIGLVPQWRIVYVDRLQSMTPAGPKDPVKTPLHDANVQPPIGQVASQTVLPVPPAKEEGQRTTDEQEPVKLKPDTQLNSLLQ